MDGAAMTDIDLDAVFEHLEAEFSELLMENVADAVWEEGDEE
jgi:hypothetical protein